MSQLNSGNTPYLEMNETGKKKMKKVYEKILEIHNITTRVEKITFENKRAIAQ